MLSKTFPENMFIREEGEIFHYGDFPDLRAGVEYFRSLIGLENWRIRREETAWRFYRSLVGEEVETSGDGRFYGASDLFAWYLFLGEAFTDHPQNYEVFYGSRIVPIFAAIGRNKALIPKISGFEDRAYRLIGPEKSQPNGGLFEMLVAFAYAREGAEVAFRPEEPGRAKTYDIDVFLRGKHWAVECKRLESGQYAENERQRRRELWMPATNLIIPTQKNTYADIEFIVELSEVPDDYLLKKAARFLRWGDKTYLWNDEYASGVIRELDLKPIQAALENGYLLYPGPIYNKLLTGHYDRYNSLTTIQKIKFAPNPHFVDEVSQAIVLRSKSLSEKAVEKKARDIKRKLFEANAQLPDDRAGIIHIGMEALEGDIIEKRRFEKTMNTIDNFDPHGKPLSFVYLHYFSPEAPIEKPWAIDETFQWRGIRPDYKPLSLSSLILPPEAPGREGVHWDGIPNKEYTD